MPASSSTLRTPVWAKPRAPPPPSTNAIRGRSALRVKTNGSARGGCSGASGELAQPAIARSIATTTARNRALSEFVEIWNPSPFTPITLAWKPMLRLLVALCAISLAAPAALAQQNYPQKRSRSTVPSPAGGIADVFARIIGGRIAEAWGQPVVVENRAGAGGNIGAELVAKSAPDGYTILMGSIGTQAVNASLYRNMPYDSAKDFTAVALVIEAESLLALHPSVAAGTPPRPLAPPPAPPPEAPPPPPRGGAAPRPPPRVLSSPGPAGGTTAAP